MNPAAFTALYLAVGATIAAIINWRYQHTSGQRLTAADHLAAFGIACVWPLLLVALVCWAVIDRVSKTRCP
jgi:hypothetical protein